MSLQEQICARSDQIFARHLDGIRRRTDRVFAVLMVVQWVLAMVLALWVSPTAWAGMTSRPHVHVWAALLLGGAIASVPLFMIAAHPGQRVTRHVVAIGQMLTSALLIHLSGGRIETHFHVFGSLAFLAFYRDWPLLVTASIMVALDHGARGALWPQSVYGTSGMETWRLMEHVSWVIFECIFLVYSVRQALTDLRGIADGQARLELANQTIEAKVEERTAQLELANHKLADALLQARRAHEKVKESERLKSRFFANVSHELRTPLTLIMAPVESALAGDVGPLSQDQTRLLSVCRNNAVRLLQLVTGLLDLSKLGDGKVAVQREPTDVAALVRSIYDDFEPLLRDKRIRGSLSVNCGGPARLDRYLFERIVFNLLSNAVKFTPAGGAISMSLERDGEALRLRVSDTGIGIDPSRRHLLFQRFHQADASSTRRFEGAGLGLALVREFAELLGGDVSVESEPGRGSVFAVHFAAPLADPADVAGPLDRARPALPAPQDFLPVPEKAEALPKVLVAEDNVELAAYIVRLLSPFCRTRIAQDGEEALAEIERWRPRLVLSDVMMPKLDGLELCRRVKSTPALNATCFLVLTAVTNREALARGWEVGADDYLFKPFHPRELVTRVTTLLKASANRELLASMALLRERERLHGEFLANMSHELRTPIASIKGYVEVLLAGKETRKERSEFLTTVSKNAERLGGLVENLLAVARLEGGHLEAQPADVCMAKCTAEILDELRPRIERRKLRVLTSLPADLKARADPQHLWQILQNLLTNAVKFSPLGSSIRISAALRQNMVEVCVADEGPGIPPAELCLIFERFHSNHRGIPEAGGAGLGLSIAKRLVELNGGAIRAANAPDRGAVFSFTLPRAASSVDSGADQDDQTGDAHPASSREASAEETY